MKTIMLFGTTGPIYRAVLDELFSWSKSKGFPEFISIIKLSSVVQVSSSEDVWIAELGKNVKTNIMCEDRLTGALTF